MRKQDLLSLVRKCKGWHAILETPDTTYAGKVKGCDRTGRYVVVEYGWIKPKKDEPKYVMSQVWTLPPIQATIEQKPHQVSFVWHTGQGKDSQRYAMTFIGR